MMLTDAPSGVSWAPGRREPENPGAVKALDDADMVLQIEYPLYSLPLSTMQIVWDLPGLETMGVDYKNRLFVNSHYAAEKPVLEIAVAMVHEINHVLRDHGERVGDRDKERWNTAADLEINSDLKQGMSNKYRPAFDNYLTPDGEKFQFDDGLTAEQYYHLLEQYGEKSDKQGDDYGSDDEGEDEDGPGGGGSDGDADDGDDGSEHKGVCQGQCGPGATDPAGSGIGQEMEDAAIEQGAKGLTPEEMDDIRDQVAAAVSAAARDAEAAGKPPGLVAGGMLRWAAERLRPQVDWRELLRTEIQDGTGRAAREGRPRRTWSKPSSKTRQVNGRMLPKRGIRKHQPEITIVVDTSGSMSEGDLGAAVAEARGIVQETGRVNIINCDSRAYDVQVADRRGDGTFELEGGGGTSMTRGIEAALEHTNPDMVVVLTDGWTDWPEDKPDTAVVIGLVGPVDSSVPDVPEWAKSVQIDPNAG